MSKETAQKLFAALETNKELKEKLAGLESPADIVKAAAEAGYDVTEAELIEAEKELRKQRAQKTDAELSADELESAAGGSLWTCEDAPDGHEIFCLLTYHSKSYSKETGNYCKEAFFCSRNYISYE